MLMESRRPAVNLASDKALRRNSANEIASTARAGRQQPRTAVRDMPSGTWRCRLAGADHCEHQFTGSRSGSYRKATHL